MLFKKPGTKEDYDDLTEVAGQVFEYDYPRPKIEEKKKAAADDDWCSFENEKRLEWLITQLYNGLKH